MRAHLITSLAVVALLGSSIPDVKADSTAATPGTKTTNATGTASTGSFSDTKGHWAETTIAGAVQKGYVDGYQDHSFKPNAKVTRAEFIKLVDTALHIPISGVTEGNDWYLPYVNAATNAGIYKRSDFTSGDWNTPMTRQEMARTAVRAATADKNIDDTKWMYLATKAGLITGLDDRGTLGEDQPTTRAQAVTTIERILTVKGGHSLAVDEKAVASAEQSTNAPKDPWGRAIRTTNLPSNSGDFPYILQDIPNEMYEHKHPFQTDLTRFTAKEIIHDSRYYSRDTVDRWVKLVSQFGNQILNVDYETIDQNWVDAFVQTVNIPKHVSGDAQKYVEWVKQNHIRIEGTVTPEPSIVFFGDNKHWVRSMFRFRVTSFDENKNLFVDIWGPKNIEKDVWYIGYTDVAIASENFASQLAEKKITSDAAFFAYKTYHAE